MSNEQPICPECGHESRFFYIDPRSDETFPRCWHQDEDGFCGHRCPAPAQVEPLGEPRVTLEILQAQDERSAALNQTATGSMLEANARMERESAHISKSSPDDVTNYEHAAAEPVYKFEQSPDAEFYYALLLPDPLNAACHIMRRPTKELWAFTDTQEKAKAICDALNAREVL